MNTLKVIILLATLSSLLLIIGYFIARGTGVMIALILSVIMNFGSYWYSDSIVLRMYDARPVTRMEAPALYDAIESLSQKARIPVPKVCVIPQTSPNAFATGRDEDHAAVAVTSGILKMLGKDELEGVIAHELSHIKHKDILISTMAATIASAVVLLSRWAMFFGGNEESGMMKTIAVAVIAPVAATLIQMAISRSREYEADAGGAEVSGKPEALAGALTKLARSAERKPMDANPATAHMFIVNPLSGGAVMNLFSTHPPLAKRIERLMKMKTGRARQD
ncbi:MAG: zinc metalloprotease HtpX [Syntrophales bacterium]